MVAVSRAGGEKDAVADGLSDSISWKKILCESEDEKSEGERDAPPDPDTHQTEDEEEEADADGDLLGTA